MVGRRANEAIAEQIVWRAKHLGYRVPNQNTGGMRWLILSKLKRTVCKGAILTAICTLVLGAARHVGIGADNPSVYRSRHLTPGRLNGHRRRNKPKDHKDHNQSLDESNSHSCLTSHETADLGRSPPSQLRHHLAIGSEKVNGRRSCEWPIRSHKSLILGRFL